MNESQLPAFRSKLLDWFQASRRDLPWRHSDDPYRIWVSEVMLQQTQVRTVIPYYNRFVEKYPDVLTLARADLNDVLKGWEGLGYYARARNLHAASRILTADGNGKLPADYDELKKLPGVGDYIAAAVCSLAFAKPHAVVDGNVKRVIARLMLMHLPVSSSAAIKIFHKDADCLLDSKNPGDFNQAMMELGATVCRPRQPLCGDCPVSMFCGAFDAGRQAEFPVRLRKKPVPKYHIAVGIVQKDDRVLITRRSPKGLLGGLWEFPGGKVEGTESAKDACRREIEEETGIRVEVLDYMTHIDHAYSHFKIGVDVFSCRYTAGDIKLHGPVDYRWILIDEIDDYPIPGANHKFLPIVKKELSSGS